MQQMFVNLSDDQFCYHLSNIEKQGGVILMKILFQMLFIIPVEQLLFGLVTDFLDLLQQFTRNIYSCVSLGV